MRKVGSFLIVGILVLGATTVHAAAIAKMYKWESMGRTWTLTQAYAFDAYRYFRMLPRVSSYTDYAAYISDPSDDSALETLVGELDVLADEARLGAWERLNFVVSFVQSLRYVPEEGEYPRYPLETLVDGCGDCEDLAILAAAILGHLGYDVVLLAFTAELHMAVGVRVIPPDSSVHRAYEWNGAAYYYVEPTGVGWTIGAQPALYTSAPDIIPVSVGS